MTLPLENPTGAILRRLTRRSLQSEKRRNGMVVIAVALGAFLLCLAGTIGASLLQIRQDQITDTYEATYAGVTQADIAALKEVPEIARAVSYTHLDVYKRQHTISVMMRPTPPLARAS